MARKDPAPRVRRFGAAAAALVAVVAIAAPAAVHPPAGVVDSGPDYRPYLGRYAPARAGVPDTLTVVSYNIQYGEDLALAADELNARPRLAAADVYLLQEMDPAGTDTLARVLGCDYVYYRASISPHHGRPFGNAVLSRWPILAHRLLVLPHEAPFTGQQRVAVAAELDVGGRRVRVVSVHTSTMIAPLPDRLDQAAAVADSLAGDDLPVVVAGDFNTVSRYESTQVRRRLWDAGLREAPLPRGATARRLVLGLVAFDFRLDHLYYDGLDLVSTGIESEARASDHVPVWAVFTWP